MAEQSRDAVLRARRLQDLQLDWRHRLTRARASALSLRLAESLFESPLVTIPQAQRALGVSYRSAQLNIAKLVAAGILRQVDGPSYGKLFLAEEILQAIGDHQT